MSDLLVRKVGRAGRITLARPDALNALTSAMVDEIAAALPGFASDSEVDLLIIDAEGEKAFCAGGDIADIYAGLTRGDPEIARNFWQREYRMNHALFQFPKPVATFMQGFTMGGGVGLGCHGSHRVVCDSSVVAMPECSLGLMPDIGGTLLLARAPGRLGEYLGTTGQRMGPGDAIHAGFADYFIPADAWSSTIRALEEKGDWRLIDDAATAPPPSELVDQGDSIDHHFAGETLRDILTSLSNANDDWASKVEPKLARNAPLAMAATVEAIHRARQRDRIEEALRLEYRFGHRIVEMGDFQEGIRAAIIDRDHAPRWRHQAPSAPTSSDVAGMLQPLGTQDLNLGGST